MATIAILGAGAGALASAVEFAQAGHSVRLWNRTEATLAPIVEAGSVRATGSVSGKAAPAIATPEIAEAVTGADAVVICLPGLSHPGVGDALARLDAPLPPVLFTPGALGSALEFAYTLESAGRRVPSIAEVSTLPYVARKRDPTSVDVTGKARSLRVASLAGDPAASEWALRLYPACEVSADVLEVGLANVNVVLHPPAAVLGAAWIEATGGAFRFYSQATTPGVGRVMQALDLERLRIARAFGHDLPGLLGEMERIGTVAAGSAAGGDLPAAIGSSTGPNAEIAAPDSLTHRYFGEDVLGTLPRLIAFAAIAAVPVPAADALHRLGALACGIEPTPPDAALRRLGVTVSEPGALLRRAGASVAVEV
jgi:opine dehydrogenase